MPKASENTMRELENILNESETYADRLAAFLKLKTAPKPQGNNGFMLGDVDISFDFDVDLVKLPPKPQPAEAAKEAEAAQKQPLREITNSNNPPAVTEHKAQPSASVTSPTQENTAASQARASITSPRRSSSRRSVPGSDRLRRVAIHRRSRSCGRRDLLKEFNDVTSSSSEFLPPISSTPATEKKTNAEPQQPIQSEPTQASVVAAPLPTQPVPPSDQMTFVSQRSATPSLQSSTTTDSGAKRRTYTIEMGPEPGQLLLSPSHKGSQHSLRENLSQRSPSNSTYNVSLTQSRLRRAQAKEQAELSAANLKILARNTPERNRSQSQPNPEYIVPETQQLPQVLHNLSSNAMMAPFMVVPMACLSPQTAQTPAQAQTQVNTATQVVAPSPVATKASRSIQTSSSPPPVAVQDLMEIMTDDESADELQASAAPLNLAPAGSHTKRLRQTRQRVQRVDNSMELLDLHRSRSRVTRSRDKCKPRQTVLNKPSRAPINGEEFARELARMSNYEILDLRKRNSIGKLYPLNGHRQKARQQQLELEQHIEWEILRRNLEEPDEQALPMVTPTPRTISTATTVSTSEKASFSAASFRHSPAAPPTDFRDSSVLDRHLDNSKQHQRRLRYRRHETLMQTSAAEISSPTAPPSEFRDNSMQSLRQPQRRLRSRHREPPMSEEDELLCTPPAQFRRSRSRSRRQDQQQQPLLPEPTLATPPLEFNDVSKTNADEDLEQLELQLPPPPEFNNRTNQTVDDEQRNTSKSGHDSKRLRTSRRQSKLEKQQQEQEQKEKQRLQKEQLQKEQQKLKEQLKEHEKREQQLQKEKQQREQQQMEMELKERQEKEQQQQKEEQLLKEKEQKEQQEEERLLMEQQQKDKSLQEQQQKEQEHHDKQEQEQLQLQHQEEPIDEHEEEARLPPPPPPENVFKKPIAPAPRAKRKAKNRLEKQLENLHINLAHETLSPNENQAPDDNANTTGVRRSKRGQVQLCNTWVHTLSDPFNFMRKNLDVPRRFPVSKHKKQTTAAATAAPAVGISIMERPPLSSSTPRNTPVPVDNPTNKRKRDHQSEEQQTQPQPSISGISTLGSETEQEVEPEQPIETVALPPAGPKKRGRKNKLPKESNSDDKKNKHQNTATTDTEQGELPMHASFDENMDHTPASSHCNESHEQPSETLLTWLCGASKVPTDTHEVSEVKTDSMVVSRAANLHFSNIDGIEYAFYNTADLYSMGYMRFQPMQTRGFKRAKTNTLRFVALHGQFDFEIVSKDSAENHRDILYTGDTIEIMQGNRYNITNRSDKVSVLMVQRK